MEASKCPKTQAGLLSVLFDGRQVGALIVVTKASKEIKHGSQ